jgi:DNA-binding ferritin-like protein
MEIQIQTITNSENQTEKHTQYFGTILNRILSNIKMMHWYVKDYNKHEIFGSLYADLSDSFDSLQEEIIGTQRSTNFDFPLFNRDSTFFDEELEKYNNDENIVLHYYDTVYNIIDILLSFEFESYVKSVESGILNTRDEIISRINKTNYLLKLTIK